MFTLDSGLRASFARIVLIINADNRYNPATIISAPKGPTHLFAKFNRGLPIIMPTIKPPIVDEANRALADIKYSFRTTKGIAACSAGAKNCVTVEIKNVINSKITKCWPANNGSDKINNSLIMLQASIICFFEKRSTKMPAPEPNKIAGSVNATIAADRIELANPSAASA